MEMETLADVVASTYSFTIKANANHHFTVEKYTSVNCSNTCETETIITEFFPAEGRELKLIVMYLSVLMGTKEVKKVKTVKELRNFISKHYKK